MKFSDKLEKMKKKTESRLIIIDAQGTLIKIDCF